MPEVRPFDSPADYERMIDYFHGADDEALALMGVDRARLPTRADWLERLLPDLARPFPEKLTYYLAWCSGSDVVGHSNANQIAFGVRAQIHLHLWTPERRRSGLGLACFTESIRRFARDLSLRQIICEPYAANPGPNRLLERAGFRFVRRYRTTPGPLNFEQEVNRWELACALATRVDAGTPAA